MRLDKHPQIMLHEAPQCFLVTLTFPDIHMTLAVGLLIVAVAIATTLTRNNKYSVMSGRARNLLRA